MSVASSRARAAVRALDPGWILCVAGATALSIAAALVPLQAAFVALALAGAAVLINRLGPRLGLWCLFVAMIPMRGPLSVDVSGSTTLFANDVLLLALTVACIRENGLRGILRRSPSFRIGALLAALTLGGLYTATRLKWGLAFAVHEAAQTAAFYVAWHWIRTGREAKYTLVAFVIGLLPAVVVGLRQSDQPVQQFLAQEEFLPAIAWDEAGNPHVRVFSTFEHPLHFSHALSMGTGFAVGLFSAVAPPARLLLASAASAFAYCNQYTYSMGGLLGTIGAVVTVLLLSRRRWVFGLLPVILFVWLLVAPQALLVRIENSFSGRNPTTGARIITYIQTLRVLQDHPVLGVGWGSIRTALEENYRITRDQNVSFTAENYFLERALAFGLVGLTLTLVLCGLFFRNARSRPPPDPLPWPRAAILCGGVAFYVQAQFIPAADPPSRYLLWILLALAERMRILARRAATADGTSR
ncbi:MAG: O-antigen ligase family protein [bacterium]